MGWDCLWLIDFELLLGATRRLCICIRVRGVTGPVLLRLEVGGEEFGFGGKKV